MRRSRYALARPPSRRSAVARARTGALSQGKENCAASTSTMMNCSTWTRYLLTPVVICRTALPAFIAPNRKAAKMTPIGLLLGEHRDRDAVEAVARREIVVVGLVDAEHLLGAGEPGDAAAHQKDGERVAGAH